MNEFFLAPKSLIDEEKRESVVCVMCGGMLPLRQGSAPIGGEFAHHLEKHECMAVYACIHNRTAPPRFRQRSGVSGPEGVVCGTRVAWRRPVCRHHVNRCAPGEEDDR